MQVLRQACEWGTFKTLELDTEYPAGPITVGLERKIWILHTLYHQKIQFPKPGKYSITNLYLHVSAIFMWTSWILKHFYTILNNFFWKQNSVKNQKNHMPAFRYWVYAPISLSWLCKCRTISKEKGILEPFEICLVMGRNCGESILSKVCQGWSEGVSLTWGAKCKD